MGIQGTMSSERPYQYNINRKKRAVAEREGLDSDEEEVEDICAIEKIEEIICAKYDRKKKRSGVPSQILQKCWKQANLVEVDTKGAVGGLVVLWNPSMVLMKGLFTSNWTITASFRIIGSNKSFFIMNVYNLATPGDKDTFLHHLECIANNIGNQR